MTNELKLAAIDQMTSGALTHTAIDNAKAAIFFYDPNDESNGPGDPYPDRIICHGPRGGIRLEVRMIHVNVRQRQQGDWQRGYVVEVSVDGASWLEHWFLATRGDNETEAHLSASSDGRIYAAGIKFGGGDVRMTAFGEDVHVPDMATIGWHAAGAR